MSRIAFTKKIIIANWKENPKTAEEAISLAQEIDSDGLVIAPPVAFLRDVGRNIKKASLGAQDMFWEEQGPFTGEVSGSQLKSLGVSYVIIGHSDRRRLGETDAMIAKKISAALKDNLIPILCVGETGEDRDAGRAAQIIEQEIKADLADVWEKSREIIIAYEPVWAIGSGIPDTPMNAIQMSSLIRSLTVNQGLRARTIYGGSVTGENAKDFLQHNEVEGALVGGASLQYNEIKKILEVAKLYGG